MEIVVGTKKWSSWSMRPWLALRHTGEPFTETLVELRHAERSETEIRKHSPSGLVPALKDGGVVIWDSLAICEYLAERFPATRLWPDDAAARALGRSAAAEMHSGFPALRSACSMDILATTPLDPVPEAVEADIRRVISVSSGGVSSNEAVPCVTACA